MGARRLRSDLATFASVLDDGRTGELRTELAWWGGVLGRVRDADVLLGRLWASSADLDADDRGLAATVLTRLEHERSAELGGLLSEMRTDRYVELLEHVAQTAAHPPMGRGSAESAAEVLPSIVRPRWVRLRRAVGRVEADPTDADLHVVRILAKKARYAVEALGPVVGEPAVALGAALARLQDELGELNDTAVSLSWLRACTPSVSHAQAVVVGQLIAAERRRAEEIRHDWRSAWQACDHKSLVRWLR